MFYFRTIARNKPGGIFSQVVCFNIFIVIFNSLSFPFFNHLPHFPGLLETSIQKSYNKINKIHKGVVV